MGTRLHKSTTDPADNEEMAKKSYEFDISKDATVVITSAGASEFIAEQGWRYETDAKYALYCTKKEQVTDTATGEKYVIPTGETFPIVGGHVYKKHFSKEERVAVPAFSENASYRNMNVFIVWDDCNDDYLMYGLKYSVGGETKSIADFDTSKLTYDITLPAGTTEVPELWAMATHPVKAQTINVPTTYTNGEATYTLTAELAKGVTTTYTVNFYVDSAAEDDVRLKSIKYNTNTDVADFSPYVRDYEIVLPFGSTYPIVSVETYNSVTPDPVVVQPSESNDGTATITVTSQNGSATAVYTVKFIIADYVLTEASVMKAKNGAQSIVTIVHDDGTIPTVQYMDEEYIGGIGGRVDYMEYRTRVSAETAIYYYLNYINENGHKQFKRWLKTTDDIDEKTKSYINEDAVVEAIYAFALSNTRDATGNLLSSLSGSRFDSDRELYSKFEIYFEHKIDGIFFGVNTVSYISPIDSNDIIDAENMSLLDKIELHKTMSENSVAYTSYRKSGLRIGEYGEKVGDVFAELQELTDDTLEMDENGFVHIKESVGDNTKKKNGTELLRRIIYSKNTIRILKDNRGRNRFEYGTIYINMSSQVMLPVYPDENHPFPHKRLTPMFIVLGHELIHADHYLRGKYYDRWYSTGDEYTDHSYYDYYGELRQDTKELEEIQTVGPIEWEKANGIHYRDVKTDNITENDLRWEHQLPLRSSYNSW